MNDTAPDHFSHRLELRLDHMPAKTSDRIALNILYPGILFGTLLFLLGSYEFFNGMSYSGHTAFGGFMTEDQLKEVTTLINPTIFDLVLMGLGMGIVIALILSYIRYKKICFDGKTIEIVYRPAWGDKVFCREKLSNYKGVRFRVEFFQFGILNKNRYIIELLHDNPAKTVPLYISTKDRNIRKIWEYYAKELKMPAVMSTDEGDVYRSIEDLDKPLLQMAGEGLIQDNFNPDSPLPKTIACARKKDKIVVKGRKVVWDAFNWLFIICGCCVLIFAAANYSRIATHISQKTALLLMGILGGLVIAAIWILLRKDKLIIKKDKIVHVHKFMLFSRKHNEIGKQEIEEIDVTLNPVSGRYFVSLISDNKNIIFGKKLPIEDLRWVKKFLIHEIISKAKVGNQ